MSVTDVYDYTDELKEKLTSQQRVKEVTKEFIDIQDNAERVKYLE